MAPAARRWACLRPCAAHGPSDCRGGSVRSAVTVWFGAAAVVDDADCAPVRVGVGAVGLGWSWCGGGCGWGGGRGACSGAERFGGSV